jgi:membrane protein DedA with SNARE-associated domain
MLVESLADSSLALCIGLFLVSLFHEETAMIGGGYLVSERGLSMEIVVLVLTMGLIAGDWGIFGMGVAARRIPRLRRWLKSDIAGRSHEWLERHLLLIVAIARVFPGPGILFPTFAGLGLLGVGFGGFALRSAVVAALYAPAALYLTILYGNVVVPRVGWWGWPALIVLLIVGFGGPWARPLRHRLASFIGLNRSAGGPST